MEHSKFPFESIQTLNEGVRSLGALKMFDSF